MISDKLQKALNGQIAAELWSSNLYLQMSFFLKHEAGTVLPAGWLTRRRKSADMHSKWRAIS